MTESSKKPIKKVPIGVIGAGWATQNLHLPSLQRLEEAEVLAICARSRPAVEEVALKFGIPRIETDWRRVVSMKDLDALVIATPPDLHCEATLAALGENLHVLCQARMARNLQEAKRMLEASRNTDRVTALCPARPGLKGDLSMKKLIREEGFLGRIHEIRVHGLEDYATDPAYAFNWGMDQNIFGVNALALGMWVEVLYRWVGTAEKVAALGQIHYQSRQRATGQWVKVSVPDSLGIVAQLQGGATATFHYSSVAQFAGDNRIELYGSEGTLVYNLARDEISGARRGESEIRPIPVTPSLARQRRIEEEFIRAITDGTPVCPDFEEGVRYMEFMEAAHISMQQGRTVGLPLDT